MVKKKPTEEILEVTQIEEITSLEEVITKELAKHNITEAILLEMEINFLPLTINGLEDKEGYLAVDNARKAVKNLRVMGVKICKDNRAEAIKFQKKWIEVEDKFEQRTKTIESALEAKQTIIDQEKDRIKQERELKEQAILHERAGRLLQMGMKLEDGAYVLDEIRISVTSAKNYDEFTWQSLIAGVKTKWREKEAIRIENEKIAEESAAEAKRIAEENLAKQEELKKKEKALAAQQHAIEEEQIRQKQAAEKLIQDQQNVEKRAKEELLKARKSSLFQFGFAQQNQRLSFKDLFFTESEIANCSEDEWTNKLQLTVTNIAHIKEKIEQEHKAEIEKAKQEAIENERKRLEKIQEKEKEDQENERIIAQAKVEAAEIEKQRLAAIAPDLDKVKAFFNAVNQIPLPDVTSEPFKAYILELNQSRKMWLTSIFTKIPK